MKPAQQMEQFKKTQSWGKILQKVEENKQQLIDSYDPSLTPDQSHSIMAVIKTLDTFKTLPDVIINEELAKEQKEADRKSHENNYSL